MDPASAKELAAALAVLASLTDKLGPGGILGLIFGSPLLMVVTFSLQSFHSGRRLQHMFEEARKYGHELWEKHREETSRLLEAYRKETAAILEKQGEGLGKTTRFYEDNVRLVEDYKQLAGNLQDLVVTNVRSLEKVAASIETLCNTMRNK